MKFKAKELVLHLKTQRIYEIVMCQPMLYYEPTGEPVYVYKSISDETVWVRPQEQMEDGRFVKWDHGVPT